MVEGNERSGLTRNGQELKSTGPGEGLGVRDEREGGVRMAARFLGWVTRRRKHSSKM